MPEIYPMPCGIECQGCREMKGLQECLMGDNNRDIQSITDHDQIKVVSLNGHPVHGIGDDKEA